ncbi:hypothetical protein HYW74_01690 [Candidatus Pacearchaeota archaeon]|nr:hypothetical protein [Candidatus Pacearchaeota archaeon]
MARLWKKRYLEGQMDWINVHKWYMGIEEHRPVTSNEATADYLKGNDQFFNGGNPTPEFHEHLSPRGLKWEEEYNIYFWYHIMEVESRTEFDISEEDISFREDKRKDIEKRELLGYQPLTLEKAV